MGNHGEFVTLKPKELVPKRNDEKSVSSDESTQQASETSEEIGSEMATTVINSAQNSAMATTVINREEENNQSEDPFSTTIITPREEASEQGTTVISGQKGAPDLPFLNRDGKSIQNSTGSSSSSVESLEAEEYRREIALAIDFQGEGVIRIHDVVNLANGEKVMLQEKAGYKTELTNGKKITAIDLEDLNQVSHQLTNEQQIQKLEIFRDALKGIARIHDMGFIHRDLKPENILITGDGRGVVTDFGMTIHKDSKSKDAYGGTPTYSAPESCSLPGCGRPLLVSQQMDVWSCGLILQDLTGGLYDHPALKGAENKGATGTIIHLGNRLTDANKAKYAADYPEPATGTVDHLIWSATQLDPNARPTIQEMHDQLELVIQNKRNAVPS